MNHLILSQSNQSSKSKKSLKENNLKICVYTVIKNHNYDN